MPSGSIPVRIPIVDFDVHHGNGTQAVFFTDPSIFFASLHEDPHVLYPNSGFEWEIGAGAWTRPHAQSPNGPRRR